MFNIIQNTNSLNFFKNAFEKISLNPISRLALGVIALVSAVFLISNSCFKKNQFTLVDSSEENTPFAKAWKKTVGESKQTQVKFGGARGRKFDDKEPAMAVGEMHSAEYPLKSNV